MSRLSLLWLAPAARRIDRVTKLVLKNFYKEIVQKGLLSLDEAERQLNKAINHKTDFITAIKISIPVNWRSSISYRAWRNRGKSGLSTIIETLRDSRMYELTATFAIALKSGDIRDEAFDEKNRLTAEEYEFKIRVADSLEELVNRRIGSIHREGFAEMYLKGRDEVFRFELKDLEYSEMFRRGEHKKIVSLYDDLKEAWHGKTAGIGERVVSLTLFEAGLLQKEPEACEAIRRYQWALTNIWMWSDELKDLFSDLEEGNINMLIVECLKRGLSNVEKRSILEFIARNPEVLEEPVKQYLDMANEMEGRLKKYPWINLRDYHEGALIVFRKLDERRRKLLENVRRMVQA
ncbi:MAG: hypothetical protein ACUVQ0_02700 [Thermoproteota archaeon]